MSAHTMIASPRISAVEKKAVRPRGGMSLLRREMVVARGLEETFAFFSDARNLEALTPPWVGFEILTPTPIEMRSGTLIDYRIRVHGVPLKWRTEIVVWEPLSRFVDVQVRGPYRWWLHTHRFEACGAGTRVIDEVEYRAPLSWISHTLMVSRDVTRIVDYREKMIRRALENAPAR